ncbi:MAG TPA: radical SAM protein, partial [Candidatus Hydrogenedentes bacterium]|nr:radical SAM protein [Candidatus Hydrogenedentota bacterium]
SGRYLYLGIASIAGTLRAAGHEVVVLDPVAKKMSAATVAESVVQTGARFLGMGPFTVDIHDAAEIARQVKQRNPSITTVLGGWHVSAIPAETLAEFPAFDIAVVGEGELPFHALANGASPEDIPGIVFRKPSGDIHATPPQSELVDLTALPPPAWNLFNLNDYPYVPVEPLRACPFNCAFCFKGATGRHVREKEPEALVAEIEELVTRNRVRNFSLAGSGTFPVRREHAMAVCQAIQERGLRIHWETSTRTDLLDRELLEAMKAAGCYGISFGIESGDPHILDKCNKGIDLDVAEDVIRLCHDIGIESELTFVLGLPYETPASIERTRQFALKVRPYSTLASFAILTPYPGTKAYEMAERNEGGLRLKTTDWRAYAKASGEAIAHECFKEGELKRYQARLYLSYYFTFTSPRTMLRAFFARSAVGLRDLRSLVALLERLVH